MKSKIKYAIIETSGKQFWVEPKQFIDINKLNLQAGTKILMNRILFGRNDKTIVIGQPYLNNLKIKATIGNFFLGPKLIIYKMKKKKYRRKQGHRQQLIRIFINNIYF